LENLILLVRIAAGAHQGEEFLERQPRRLGSESITAFLEE
jgi:hypothetical protein